jgi:hypothetical protein
MKLSGLQKLTEFFLDNLFDIVTILIAGYVVIRHQVRPYSPSDIGELSTWILAVLGLIAVSGLWERNRRLHRIEKISEESRDLVLRRLSGKVYARDFLLSGREPLSEILSSANTIFLAGITLTRTTREYMDVLRRRLAAGAHVRLILIDPTVNSVMEEMALRSMGETTPDYWRTRMGTVVEVIRVIGSIPDKKGKLELGYLPYIPSFGHVIVDPDEPHGFAIIEMYHHRSAEPNPTFHLRASDDHLWYNFFRRQYDILWASCRIEEI